MSQMRTWSIVGAVAAVAVLVAGWFLLISPKRSEAADFRSETKSQLAANDGLRARLKELQALAADKPKLEARLAAIRKQIPGDPALPRLIRDLSAGATGTGVQIESIAPTAPEAVVAPATGTTGAPVVTGAAPATGTNAAAATEDGVLMAVPVQLKLTGDYVEMEQFVNRLESLQRSFLVNGFALTKPQVASNGPATTSSAVTGGDLELTIQGRVFMVTPAATVTTTAPAPATAPATAPTPAPTATTPTR